MELSPEERRRIYEEEKAKIEAEEASQKERWRVYHEEKARLEAEQRAESDKFRAQHPPTLGLDPNLASLLCYLGLWVTGIVFILIEQRSKVVRFHAIQSTLVFGAISVAGAILAVIPFVGAFFGVLLAVLTFILWLVLMVKAYRGEQLKMPLAGDVAARASGI